MADNLDFSKDLSAKFDQAIEQGKGGDKDLDASLVSSLWMGTYQSIKNAIDANKPCMGSNDLVCSIELQDGMVGIVDKSVPGTELGAVKVKPDGSRESIRVNMEKVGPIEMYIKPANAPSSQIKHVEFNADGKRVEQK